MHSFFLDLRFGLRMLRKNPTFTVVAVLTLALGIGAVTAIFSVVSAMLLRPFPVSHPEQLTAIYSQVRGGQSNDWSYPQYLRLRESGIYQGVAAQAGLDLSVAIGNEAELLWANMVTENYFQVLGMKPILGRLFEQQDDRGRNSDPIVVLSYDCWQRRFASDPTAIGRKLLINGHPFTVVGVAPPEFHGTRLMGYWAEMWVPIMTFAQVMPGSEGLLERQTSHWLLLIARLKPRMNLAEAEQRTSAFALHLGETEPADDRLASAVVISARTQFDNPSWVSRKILAFGASLGLGATFMVLLIACSNVANLLMAKATTRRREIATRLALGASRWRLIRQMLTEGMLLAGIACPVGLALASASQIYSGRLVPPGPFRLGFGETLDSSVVWFAICISSITAILFGLAPALRVSRVVLVPELKNQIPAVRVGSRRLDLRSFLVVIQISVASALLICGGLFARSLGSARNLDLGFQRANRFIMSFDLSVSGYDQQRGDRFQREVLRRVRELPGVRSASMAFPLPLDYESTSSRVFVPAKTDSSDHETENVWSARVDPGYFATMGTPILAGREFTDSDDTDAPSVVIVNQAMAKLCWPNKDAVGRELRLGGRTGKSARVVGVARDGKYVFVGDGPTPALWTPLRQSYSPWVEVVVESVGDPSVELGVVRQEIQRMDPNVAVFGAQTINTFLKRALNLAETEAYLGATFALMALMLAVIGLYGVFSFSVAQRTREIGIRMALGAKGEDVLRLVLSQAIRLAGVGILAGTLAGLALAQVVRSLLYNVSAHDPRVFVVTPIVLTLVALVATYFPAWRATKIDPLVALRYE